MLLIAHPGIGQHFDPSLAIQPIGHLCRSYFNGT
jgi:hypothetical protein